MIAKIRSGSRAAGLVYYLLGPGKDQEHVDPRIIGAWNDKPGELEAMTGAEIGRELEAALAIQRLDPAKMVWHTSLRNHADDRVLSDEEWIEVARDVLDRTGIAPRGDEGAARWIVVRHDDDHVHLAAVLARQDTGGRIRPSWDYVKARAACSSAERRLGLKATNEGGHGRPGRSRPEEERVRDGGVDLRGSLRRAAQVAVAASTGPDEFVAQLRAQGVMVETRSDPDGVVTGYRVALPDQDPVWFGGSRLHRSLSWPQLARRWEPGGVGSLGGLGDGDALVEEFDAVVASIEATPVAELDGTDVPEATAEVLRAAGHLLDGRHDTDLARAVDEFYRSVGDRPGVVQRSTRSGVDLRTIAVALMLGDHRRDTAQRIVMGAVLLMQATAQLRRLQERVAQADAALRAAEAVAARSDPGARTGTGSAGSGRATDRAPTPDLVQPGRRRPGPRRPPRGPRPSR